MKKINQIFIFQHFEPIIMSKKIFLDREFQTNPEMEKKSDDKKTTKLRTLQQPRKQLQDIQFQFESFFPKQSKIGRNYNKFDWNNKREKSKSPIKSTLFLLGTSEGKLLAKQTKIEIQPSEWAFNKMKNSQKNEIIVDNDITDKYWKKRYLFFEKFDQGISLDKESWYSVTPEAVAIHVANSIPGKNLIILDGFCGAGGDTIKLAAKCKKIISNDIDPKKLKCLSHNAEIYGVKNINSSCSNFLKLKLQNIKIDIVYLAPPWGGVNYHFKERMNPEDFTPSLVNIISHAFEISQNIVMLLPFNTNQSTLTACFSNLAPRNGPCIIKIEKIYFLGSFKFIGVFYGHKFIDQTEKSKQTQFIQNYIDSDERYKMAHKSLLRHYREEYGIIELLNKIILSQKENQKGSKFEKFVAFIRKNNLLENDKINKLLQTGKNISQLYEQSQNTSKVQNKLNKLSNKLKYQSPKTNEQQLIEISSDDERQKKKEKTVFSRIPFQKQ